LTIFAFFAVAVTKEDLRRQRYEELKRSSIGAGETNKEDENGTS
jgi:hypothetical protein